MLMTALMLMRSHSWALLGGAAQLHSTGPDRGQAHTCNKCLGESEHHPSRLPVFNHLQVEMGSRPGEGGGSLLEKNTGEMDIS